MVANSDDGGGGEGLKLYWVTQFSSSSLAAINNKNVKKKQKKSHHISSFSNSTFKLCFFLFTQFFTIKRTMGCVKSSIGKYLYKLR